MLAPFLPLYSPSTTLWFLRHSHYNKHSLQSSCSRPRCTLFRMEFSIFSVVAGRRHGCSEIWPQSWLVMGHAVARLVDALRYRPEGRTFWCLIVSLEVFIDLILPATLPYVTGGRLSLWQKRVPGIFPGGKGGRYLRLITLPPSCVNCLEIWEPQLSGNLRARPGMYNDWR